MGIYQKICYTVENVFVKLLTKNQDPAIVQVKVSDFRTHKETLVAQKKAERTEKQEEQNRIRAERRAQEEKLKQEQEERERQAVLSLLSGVVDPAHMNYTPYEYREVKQNKAFFSALIQQVLEKGEKGLTFLHCEFDKSKHREIRGYLIVTTKRVLFLTKDLSFMEKYRYQTIINVNWFKDGFAERGLYIQYGKKRLEFDEIYDREQMNRVGNLILHLASNK